MAKKILKVKIKRDVSAKGTHYTYPPEYKAEKIQVLGYESMSPDCLQAVKDRGDKDEYCIGVVKEADAPAFLASADITEMTVADAKTLGSEWIKVVTRNTDPNKVIAILSKSEGKRTAAEKNALDPANPEPGINNSKSFNEIVDEALV